ncbi:MAG: CoA transferase [Ilumatobacteraceae bacterium]
MSAERPGPLAGVRVVELAGELSSYCGKLLADLGADVVVVEPPGGHASRSYGPFVDDVPDPERSLWWWWYNTSKRGVVVDLATADGRLDFRRLAATADIVVESEHPGHLAALHIDHGDIRAAHPDLIWVSVTPFGRSGPRAADPATDLTILAGGGPVWSCGYDDHTLPPVRGGGNQGLHTASVFALMSALVALVHRDAGGSGQHIDVNAHAAANVTTEISSVSWLLAGRTVQRQTGRHAMLEPTLPVQVLAADGRYVTTGFAPQQARHFQLLLDWMDELGVREDFPEAFFLELGIERGGIDSRELEGDPEGLAIMGAGRDALVFIASKVAAYDFFVGSQERGMQCGIIWTPDEALFDTHFQARGIATTVRHDDIGRDVVYADAPIGFTRSPSRISRRAPHLGEHDGELLGDPGAS